MTQRDAFMEGLTERAGQDERILVLADDFTCDMAERFRHRFPHRFINTGPMEQTLVDVAVGMALSGRLPVVFGIAPFLIHRAQEQLRLAAVMGVGITIVGVGAGCSYDEAGPTHHGTEDYASARAIPGVTVWTCSDSAMARFLVSQVGEGDGPQYFRLDRQELPEIHTTFYPEKVGERFRRGYWVHRYLKRANAVVFTHGVMTQQVLKLCAVDCAVVEVLKFPIPDDVVRWARESSWVAVEEGCVNGGLASAIHEACNKDEGYKATVHHEFVTGGRQAIWAHNGLSEEELATWIRQRCV